MASDRFVVFTTDNCKWCDKAKALLTLNDLEFKAFNVKDPVFYPGDYSFSETHNVEPKPTVVRKVFDAFGFKTAPQVFHVSEDGKVAHIGGFTELQAYLDAR